MNTQENTFFVQSRIKNKFYFLTLTKSKFFVKVLSPTLPTVYLRIYYTNWVENEDTIPVFTNGDVMTNYVEGENPMINAGAINLVNENAENFEETIFFGTTRQDTLLNQRLK